VQIRGIVATCDMATESRNIRTSDPWSPRARIVLESPNYRRTITLERAASKCKRGEASFRRGLIAVCAGIRHNHGDVTQIHPVPNRWFNTNLKSNAGNHERVDPAIAESDIERRSDEGGHSDLVYHPVTRQRGDLRRDLKSRRVPQKRWLDLVNAIHVLPSHGR